MLKISYASFLIMFFPFASRETFFSIASLQLINDSRIECTIVMCMTSSRSYALNRGIPSFFIKIKYFSTAKWQNKKRLARNHELQYFNNSVIYMHVHNDKETPLQ